MKKLKSVTLMFDDGSEVSMESAKESNMHIKTELPEPLLLNEGETYIFQFLPPPQDSYTTVAIDFVLSKVSINGDRELTEFIRLASEKG